MKNINQLLTALLIILPLLINANVWDNLFLGQGITVKLPRNFRIVLSIQQSFGRVEFEIKGSSDMNCLSVSQRADVSGVLSIFVSNLVNFRGNFTDGTLHAYSRLKGCLSVQDEKLELDFYKLVMGYINIGTLLISKEREGDYYKLKSRDLYQMANVTNYVDNLDLTFYFDVASKDLKKIEVRVPNYEAYVFDVLKFEEYNSNYKDFIVPNFWKCDKETSIRLEGIDTKEIMEEISEASKRLDGIDFKEIAEEIKNREISKRLDGIDTKELIEAIKSGETSKPLDNIRLKKIIEEIKTDPLFSKLAELLNLPDVEEVN